MTIVYTHETTNGARCFGNFPKLLFRWKGSIYKLVLPDLIVYAIVYYGINMLYRFYIADLEENHHTQRTFHQLVDYCKEVSKIIPLQFVLGFYVSQIVTRWWSQFMIIPWPDTLAVITATAVQGHDERGRMMRRTILRYVNLALIFTFTMVSVQARKRFPCLQFLVDAGFLQGHEKVIIETLNEKLEGPKYYVPLVWCGAICARARKEGRIQDDVALYHLVKEICKFRSMAGDLLSYDWICIPIVYTQVVTLAVYFYFMACLVGKQLIQRDDHSDIYVPVFHFLEFFFLMGWLKVAEVLINPFGEDDEDFEVNWLIDRNIMVSYMIVDEMGTEFPEMIKDQYWDHVVPEELYYTENALKYRTEGYRGSVAVATGSSISPNYDSESKKGDGSIIHSQAYVYLQAHRLGSHEGQHHARVGDKESLKDSRSPVGNITDLYDRTFVPHTEDSLVDQAKSEK